MTEELDKQKVRAVWPNAYVDWFMSTHEYVIWSTDDPSEKILGRGPKKYAAWQNAAESLPAAPEQEIIEGSQLSATEKERCEFCQLFAPLHSSTCFHWDADPKPTPAPRPLDTCRFCRKTEAFCDCKEGFVSREVEGGEWIQPVMKGYRMECCDCGLVHVMNFRHRMKKIQFQAFRESEAKIVLGTTLAGKDLPFWYKHIHELFVFGDGEDIPFNALLGFPGTVTGEDIAWAKKEIVKPQTELESVEADYLLGRCLSLLDTLAHYGDKEAKEVRAEIAKYVTGLKGQSDGR